jgi:hypothetical protein
VTNPARTDPRITDDDVQAASEAGYRIGGTVEDPDMRAALGTVFRPGGVVGRAVAGELDQLATGLDRSASQIHGDYHEAQAARDAYENAAERARDAAAEWREGRR